MKKSSSCHSIKHPFMLNKRCTEKLYNFYVNGADFLYGKSCAGAWIIRIRCRHISFKIRQFYKALADMAISWKNTMLILTYIINLG